ncbi:MAG: hypothetical protein ABIT01_20185 [Thermoanaerobaculia bacterium]
MGISLGFLLVLTLPATSQNLVVNDTFDVGPQISGWASFGSALVADGGRSWSANDANGLSASGSALMTISATAPVGTLIGLSQCIDISAQAALSTYKFFTSADALAVQNQESRAIVEVAFFSNAACTTFQNLGEGQGGNVSLVPPIGPPWKTFPGNATAGGTEGTATAPAGANGLQVRLYLERTSGTTQQQIQFDSAVVHLQGTTPATLTRFEAE